MPKRSSKSSAVRAHVRHGSKSKSSRGKGPTGTSRGTTNRQAKAVAKEKSRISSKSRKTGHKSPKPPAKSRQRSTKEILSELKTPLDSTTRGLRIGENLLSIMGGEESARTLLSDSTHPKARALLDRLTDGLHAGESFATQLVAVGMKATDVLDIVSDVQMSRELARAIGHAGDVIGSLVRAAKDEIVDHDHCNGTGWILDKEGNETERECKRCQGTGKILVGGSLQSQELYFELIQWKKSGGLVNIDARRQSVGKVDIFTAGGADPGEPVDPNQIIRRADQVVIPPSRQITAPSLIPDILTMDEVLEPESVEGGV